MIKALVVGILIAAGGGDGHSIGMVIVFAVAVVMVMVVAAVMVVAVVLVTVMVVSVVLPMF